jgi:mono/diheme cytochrome c family protein
MRPFLVIAAALTVCVIGCRKSPRVSSATTDKSTAAPSDFSPNDQLILAAVRIALPPPGITPGDLPEPGSAGAVSVSTYCAQCHNLPSPSMHSATDWPGVVRRMWLRMDRLPSSFNIQAPDEGTRAQMVAYLTANALQVSGSSLPPGPGRQEFAQSCSRCHALPDIRVHSPRDWLSVFMRMERNMERMNVQPLTKDEASKVLTYLQNSSAPN